MLEIKSLDYYYDDNNGIKQIDILGNEGDVIAIIGPNGSGKSTLVKCIVGMLHPQKGRVTLNYMSVLKKEVKKNIGYSAENMILCPEMTISEILSLICEVKYEGKYFEEIEYYLKKFSLYEVRNKLISNCSMGMKKKVELISALIGKPQLIVLDEPTNALDTNGIIILKEMINMLKDKGSIIIITSHILDFVEKVSTRNIFLKSGKIVLEVKNEDSFDLEKCYVNIFFNN